jgi:hypothetical protein
MLEAAAKTQQRLLSKGRWQEVGMGKGLLHSLKGYLSQAWWYIYL